MNKDTAIIFRKATKGDIHFLSHILISAAKASGVSMRTEDLPDHPDTYQYVEGFPRGTDTVIVAESKEILFK